MDHAKCVEYWGADVDACLEFPKSGRSLLRPATTS